MTDRNPQGGFEPYKQWLSNVEHYKRNTGRHSLDDYTEIEELVDDS